jgi:hypothetical protein
MGQHAPYVLNFNDGSDNRVAFEPGSFRLGNDLNIEDVQVAGHLKPSLKAVLARMPYIRCTIPDPTFVDDWKTIKSGGDYDYVIANMREVDEDDAFTANYDSYRFDKGVLVPVSLAASRSKACRVDVLVVGLFGETGSPPVSDGSAFTVGVVSDSTLAAQSVAYIPKDVVIGATTYTRLMEVSLAWTIDVQTDDQKEPIYAYHTQNFLSGSLLLRDSAYATQDVLEDGADETTFTITLEDTEGGSDKTFTLGNVKVTKAEIQNRDLRIEFSQVE